MAGLAAAVRLAGGGRAVTVYEGAGVAGGRCRSFHDKTLDAVIDNGTHLLLSGNANVLAYLRAIGAEHRLVGPARARFDFRDAHTGERWTVAPSAGAVPWWVLSGSRRIPGTRAIDYLSALRLAGAGAQATVAQVLDQDGALFKRFWQPLCVAALNTAADEASARLLWRLVRETFGRGEAACRPLMAPRGLSETFVDPALALLADKGARVRFSTRLRGIGFEGGRVAALELSQDRVLLGSDDLVVLAVPPFAAKTLLGDAIAVPDQYRAIVNVHYRLPSSVDTPRLLGVIGGRAEWIFRRGAIAAVTVSAADGLAKTPPGAIAAEVWPEVAAALDVDTEPRPPFRVIKEMRATIAQTPGQLRRRPEGRSRWPNLLIAGDWTDTGLPATIEGALASGFKAAGLACETPPNC